MAFRDRGLLPAMVFRILFATTILLASFLLYAADNPPTGSNSDPTYQQLRTLTLGNEAVSVGNFDLKRDAGTFHLRSGTVCFVAPVNGKVTGAVFSGDGSFVLDPPVESERKSLTLLTNESTFNENFGQAVFRFTDSTYDELKKIGTATPSICSADLLKDTQYTTRHKFKNNLEARLLEDVLSSEPGDFFLAFIHGKRYNDKELYQIDPDESTNQVNFYTYDENKWGHWASFNMSGEHAKRTTGKLIRIEHQQLDVTFEKSGSLAGKAATDFVALRNGLRVVPFNLFRTLRVQSVTANEQPLSFIQEDKIDDANFAVILPKALVAGEKFSVMTTYEGKDAVENTGGGNYYPVARDDWYPNDPAAGFGGYTLYDMTLRIPKGMKMAATGVLVSESNEGDKNVSVWKSEGPQTVAGFNFGRFKVEEVKLTKPEYFIQSYANEESPDWVKSLRLAAEDQLGELAEGPMTGTLGPPTRPNVAVGSMNTTELNKKALAEAQLAVQLYTDYFGPSMFKHLQLTQQTACNYGQAWPELVWLPLCYYFDTTVRHQLVSRNDPFHRRLEEAGRGYWKVVTPHEVAHQWWAHTVGFDSGRDQWMSEGFSEMSASLYISMIEKNPKKFLEFWNDEREMLLERNAQGFRAIDVGPLTMGYRTDNSRVGFDVTRRLIYPKGAYILHMLRMMMYSTQAGDSTFKATMQDFVKTYSGKAATTEDFKAMVEKHMTPDMDLDGNHRMDWFFNEYVYGTALPTYKFDSSFDKDANGDVVFSFKLAQSGVDDKFRMTVPIYLEMPDGRTGILGRARLVGNTSAEQKVPLKGWKTVPKRALINYNDDVLASN